jgi:hypothetical protein
MAAANKTLQQHFQNQLHDNPLLSLINTELNGVNNLQVLVDYLKSLNKSLDELIGKFTYQLAKYDNNFSRENMSFYLNVLEKSQVDFNRRVALRYAIKLVYKNQLEQEKNRSPSISI